MPAEIHNSINQAAQLFFQALFVGSAVIIFAVGLYLRMRAR